MTLVLGTTACKKEEKMDNQSVQMIAKVLKNDDVFLVDVIESEYTFGEYILIVNDTTTISDKKGNKIKKTDLTVGDKIKVSYSGQVMLSYPPQVVAYKIEVL